MSELKEDTLDASDDGFDTGDSIVPGVTTFDVNGIGYGDLSLDGQIIYHHSWYLTFLERGRLSLAMYNIDMEYKFRRKLIKQSYCS